MPYTPPPDIWDLLVTLILSLVSGAVSISRRIVLGHQSSILWVISEFLTAILCGYLMFTAYPVMAPILPDWITMPVAVAIAAHSGGRIFQESEEYLVALVERRLRVKR